ncbi:MAG TPA: class I SAM-dependent methyltransferase [Acidimicrobiales bacterium]|nr:class I SAM-dependent methyltransferase [Acidimicrobiales bacterium]
MSKISWDGDEIVLDIGCGNGTWLDRLQQLHPSVRTIGLDLSEGMLRSAAARKGPRPSVVADAQALPVRDESVDVALTMHMLYHVPDVPMALDEARRVLKREGRVFVTTPGQNHLGELRSLLEDAMTEVRGEEVPRPIFENTFSLGAAPRLLGEYFTTVELEVTSNLLEIPVVEPVVDYLDSQQGPDLDALLPSATSWSDVLESARRRAGAVIAERGVFTAKTEVGGLLCRR